MKCSYSIAIDLEKNANLSRIYLEYGIFLPEKLNLSLLGNLEILRDGVLVTDLRAAKALALLSYLAVTGRPQTRPALAGLLWGGMPEAKARGNLSKALSALRRLFGDHLTITRQQVAFNREGDYWLDVEAFEAQVNRGDIEQLQQAVELYQGDFLAEFYVRQAPEFEQWVLSRRAQLRELALQALHILASHFSDQGEVGRATAIAYTTRLLRLEPWREEAHRQRMLLLARSGRRSTALAQYESCRQVLAEELGVEPSAETVALYERIRDGALSKSAAEPASREALTPALLPPSTPAPLHNLPAQTTPFVGRDTELAELTELLAQPELRLITVVGPGGMGKTRLALELAATQLDCFEHGVYFVHLGPLESAEGIVPAIAEALNFSFYDGGSPQEQLHNYLREKQVLLLDNYEHLLAPSAGGTQGGVGIAVELLKAASGLKILATSRARLNVREEQRFSIGGIATPDGLQPENIAQFSAVKLFLASARRIRPDFVPMGEDMAPIARICQLVQGMPLAIILAATWLEVLTPAEIAGELGRSLDFWPVTGAISRNGSRACGPSSTIPGGC